MITKEQAVLDGIQEIQERDLRPPASSGTEVSVTRESVDATTGGIRPQTGQSPQENDVATINARYAGTCCECGKRFAAGTSINYTRSAPKGRRTLHVDCSNPDGAANCTICGGVGSLHGGRLCQACGQGG